MWEKLDKKLFKMVEYFILHRVKKSKFKKHKYQILLKYQYVEAVIIFAIILGNIIDGYLWFNILMVILLVLWMQKIKTLKELSELYSWCWAFRKDPKMYKEVKEICKLQFEDNKKRRKRIIPFIGSLEISFGILNLLAFVTIGGWGDLAFGIFFFYSFIDTIFTSYTSCVFDFDPPKKKKKKKKAKMTNLQKARWTDILKQPQGLPKPV